MDYYNARLADRENSSLRQEVLADGKIQTISGTGEASVADIALLDEQGERCEIHDVGRPVTLQVKVAVHAPIPRLVLGYMIKDRLGQVMYGTNTHIKALPQDDAAAGETFTYRFSFPLNLGPGTYSVATALVSSDTHLLNNYEWRDLALVFTITNITREHFAGCAWLNPVIQIDRS